MRGHCSSPAAAVRATPAPIPGSDDQEPSATGIHPDASHAWAAAAPSSICAASPTAGAVEHAIAATASDAEHPSSASRSGPAAAATSGTATRPSSAASSHARFLIVAAASRAQPVAAASSLKPSAPGPSPPPPPIALAALAAAAGPSPAATAASRHHRAVSGFPGRGRHPDRAHAGPRCHTSAERPHGRASPDPCTDTTAGPGSHCCPTARAHADAAAYASADASADARASGCSEDAGADAAAGVKTYASAGAKTSAGTYEEASLDAETGAETDGSQRSEAGRRFRQRSTRGQLLEASSRSARCDQQAPDAKTSQAKTCQAADPKATQACKAADPEANQGVAQRVRATCK